MKSLHFDYCMQINYAEAVSDCYFTIKCIPKSNARQQVSNIQIELEPNTSKNYGIDGFGNQQIYGLNEGAHKTFSFHICGNAKVGLASYEEEENENLTMIFRHPHGLNVPGEAIKQYFAEKVGECRGEKVGEDVLAIAEEMMGQLYRDFSYQPNSTTVRTTAEEAFLLGHGVCQDYAHILIALLHLAKIPARYVTGLLIGEGASHAWVEVLSDGRWYGFDPTNNMRVTTEHIKIGIGRDAGDCMINRGIMHGGGLHTQIITVKVQEDMPEIS